MKRNLQFALVLVVLALGGAEVVFASDIGELKQTPPGAEQVEAAFNDGKATRDWSGVRTELAKLFADESPDAQNAAVEWLGLHSGELNPRELQEFGELFLRVNPTSLIAQGFRRAVARLKLEHLGVEERAALYRRAIAEGRVLFDGVLEVPASNAVLLAANEGLTEFAPYLDTYATEFNRTLPLPDCKQSDVLAWKLKLRAGAKDRTDALTVQARSLATMGPVEVAQLFARDKAFVMANHLLALTLCQEQRSDGCRIIAKVAEAQEEIHRTQVKAMGLAPTPGFPAEEPDWLKGLTEPTAWTRSLMKQEEVETARQER